MVYGYGPKDPRYLEMTEHEMARDLLMRAYYGRQTREAAEPGADFAADASADTTLADSLQASGKAFMEDPATLRGLRELRSDGRTEETPQMVTISVTGAGRRG